MNATNTPPALSVAPLTYTIPQLAAAIQVSESTLAKLSGAGAIPGRLCRKPALWDRRAVDRWVSAGCPGLAKGMRHYRRR